MWLCPSGEGGERWIETTSKLGVGAGLGEGSVLGACAVAAKGNRSADASRMNALSIAIPHLDKVKINDAR
jgi:hypothetical protein